MINYSTGAVNNAVYAQQKCNFKTIVTSKAFVEKIDCPVIGGMVFIEDIMDGISGKEKLKAALVAKLKGYPLTCVLPENATEERRRRGARSSNSSRRGR
jgi:hypothetical protein